MIIVLFFCEESDKFCAFPIFEKYVSLGRFLYLRNALLGDSRFHSALFHDEPKRSTPIMSQETLGCDTS